MAAALLEASQTGGTVSPPGAEAVRQVDRAALAEIAAAHVEIVAAIEAPDS